ncbi:MAG: methyltransferase domain-containing protein [Christiangramia sp.]|nr:methyltransferase domain-containing protein [Christiangramia sp.]
MNRSIFAYLLCILFTVTSCISQDGKIEGPYTYKTGDPNGIGKWYLGREISHVMGYQGIIWLERQERQKEENTTRLLANMDIQPDDVIADIGAGSGYHVFKMAPQVPEGEIYAVDIQPEMLQAMRIKKKKLDAENVKLIKGAEETVNLPADKMDKVLMVDVYHEFEYPVEMMASIKKSLKDNGEVFLIEYRGEDKQVPIKELHKMTEKQAVKEMNAAGFKLKRNITNLPWQHCMIFVKN